MTSTSFQPILDAALADYTNQVGIDLAKLPPSDSLRSCGSPDEVLKVLEDKANQFKDFRDGNRKLLNWLSPVVHVVHTLSAVLGASITLVPFEPAKVIFSGVDVLFAAASGVSSSYDALVELFECLANFLKRLRIYTDLPLTPSMTEISIKIMVELLSVLALATKQIKQGRFKKFARKLLGESEIEGILRRLDRLTQEEGRMTMAQTLEVVYGLMNNVKVVINDGKVSVDGIWKALDMMQQIANDLNKMKRDRLQRESRTWLTPPDPSPNYNIAREIHQSGTATWFCEGSVFAEWNRKGFLLWIDGKPGSGKTILMSTIIREIDKMRKAGLASMAYFFFDFRDTQKQHRRDLLSSLLFQLSARSDACHHIFSRFYLDHDEGVQQPSDNALSQCLINMLKASGQPATYIIIDALDESPNISGTPTARENVLQFVEELVSSKLPNVHICLSSRPEIDIRTILEPLAIFRVSLHEEKEQMADISGYIKSFVHSDRTMRRWTAENRQQVIDTLSKKADGMFRWVYCLLDILRRCFPASIHSILDHLPVTLDETYEHMLRRIDKVKRQFACRLLQCIAVSVRPLRVEELADILAVRFDPGALPQFNAGWRLGDAEEAVLSACSSLIIIVNVNGSRIVQFAHFSVKEFLTSDRLATTTEDLSRFHITPHLAHTTLAHACLGFLLQLDDRIDKDGIRNFPLADYAARHWFEHARFEDVSSTIRDATERLFDRDRPHFSAWVWIYDIDDPWRSSTPTKHPRLPDAPPLYYAILCRLQWLIEHLISTYPGDIDAKGGYHRTPWIAAFDVGDIDIGCSLLRRGADVNVLSGHGNNPLHDASLGGRGDIVRLLLDHNVDVDLLSIDHQTPLLAASCAGHRDISRLLIQHGANVNSRSSAGYTPLNVASDGGRFDAVRLLLDNGADVDSPNYKYHSPLHSAAAKGHLDIVKLLLDSGADFNTRDVDGKAPLDLAFDDGRLEVANFLSGHIKSASSLDGVVTPSTSILQPRNKPPSLTVQPLRKPGEKVKLSDSESPPLYTASEDGQLDVVRSLLDGGSDVDETDSGRRTALWVASGKGRLEVAKLLIERGAYVDSRSRAGWTPLQNATYYGYLEVTRLLLDHGADVNAQNRRRSTPLHVASSEGHLQICMLLVERGADLDVRDSSGRIPRQEAMSYGEHRIAEFLSEYGTCEG
ncbi:ankyrin repeat-containing domain protein [Lactarius vividus]|nr:ankyrin repeat-containing domain protein [Lactarius vividus]